VSDEIEAARAQGYRPGVGVMLLDRENRVFVGRRIDTTGDNWQMPQGGIDRGESPRQAALRELKEEVGTDKAEILAEAAKWLRYDVRGRSPDGSGADAIAAKCRNGSPCGSSARTTTSTCARIIRSSTLGNGSPRQSCRG